MRPHRGCRAPARARSPRPRPAPASPRPESTQHRISPTRTATWFLPHRHALAGGIIASRHAAPAVISAPRTEAHLPAAAAREMIHALTEINYVNVMRLGVRVAAYVYTLLFA